MPKWPSLTLKFSSFWHADFWKMIIFRLHGQYAYQMKALSILNSYLLSKSTIVYEICWKNSISKFFTSIFEGKKNFDHKFFKKIFLQPPNFFQKMILKTKNGNYTKVWQSWRHPERSGKQSKLLRADSILHREFLLRNGVGKTCLLKKYILLCECIQKQGKMNFWNRTLFFLVAT